MSNIFNEARLLEILQRHNLRVHIVLNVSDVKCKWKHPYIIYFCKNVKSCFTWLEHGNQKVYTDGFLLEVSVALSAEFVAPAMVTLLTGSTTTIQYNLIYSLAFETMTIEGANKKEYILGRSVTALIRFAKCSFVYAT